MGGKASRDKGARGEAEVAKIINERLNMEICRTPRSGAWEHARGDLYGFPGHGLEIKRQETTKVDKWFEQAQEQVKGDEKPVLIYRRSRQPWKVVILLDDWLDYQERLLKDAE